mgnify:CR=1 FL=1
MRARLSVELAPHAAPQDGGNVGRASRSMDHRCRSSSRWRDEDRRCAGARETHPHLPDVSDDNDDHLHRIRPTDVRRPGRRQQSHPVPRRGSLDRIRRPRALLLPDLRGCHDPRVAARRAAAHAVDVLPQSSRRDRARQRPGAPRARERDPTPQHTRLDEGGAHAGAPGAAHDAAPLLRFEEMQASVQRSS